MRIPAPANKNQNATEEQTLLCDLIYMDIILLCMACISHHKAGRLTVEPFLFGTLSCTLKPDANQKTIKNDLTLQVLRHVTLRYPEQMKVQMDVSKNRGR